MGQGWGQHVSHVQQLAPPARHPAAHATHPTTSPPPPAHAVQLGGGVVAVAPTRRRPKGVVHFLGGAFVAAVPHLTYPLLLERLADGGYTCIATPYPVTFQHVECAHAVHAAFEGALAQLRGGGGSGGGGGGALASWAAPRDAPVHGVGHSNGALLHLLVGSGRPGRASNILISYNNLQVAEAVPVGDGFQDFRPSPIEARQLIASRYSVPSTLLIQFSDDSTDESPEAEAFLASGRRAVRRLVLPGTHVTPCGDQLGPRIPPGGRFGPADALAMAAAAALQADTHRLADRVLEHLDSQS
ncbi:hypothetical protein CHLNCDRAFT_29389 [Chlorella variabilis]|uniref:Alpha/beta hydrolase fold-5 domain-containing protein n=1 Tax=Chlorella variabilis TaxID=554065 RepID=E1Z3I4_CHLVA|nr:hypothetical protein CHLNCDRAFT_29389 [Chlorella variabilis]EFN59858.1 hypothetical protein CHLNCDRAFT_29389 [Chlorella variabilis]|eukprot:XP_005851960.1 hypothetical protein CHLNCDRAFT_29389 [Chlorella variabilis]